ncbi:MAG: hypothetical protein BGO11_01075 [Solirubrobacterales bacterium 70-9]|nr:MAG: hypothetical protein BGO11_01075 [Solirubrobacterales bacterium 70-9]
MRAVIGPRAQSTSLIALGAFAVHQLRYLLAYGGAAGDELAGQGHDYLTHMVPMILGFGLAVLTARLVRGLLGGSPSPRAERRLKATSYALGIAAVFCCQELAEGALFAGHAAGLGAIFAGGGWTALPLAALFGVIAALLDRGIEVIESLVAPAGKDTARPPRLLASPTAPQRLGRRRSPIAFGLAQRPPPSAA